MIITIIITFWITCAIIYVSKKLSMPFSSSRSFLIILDIIFSPYHLYSDIKSEWNENRVLRNRYK